MNMGSMSLNQATKPLSASLRHIEHDPHIQHVHSAFSQGAFALRFACLRATDLTVGFPLDLSFYSPPSEGFLLP